VLSNNVSAFGSSQRRARPVADGFDGLLLRFRRALDLIEFDLYSPPDRAITFLTVDAYQQSPREVATPVSFS